MNASAAKHTKGHWRLTPKYNSLFPKDVDGYLLHTEMDTIATICHWSNEPVEAQANAHLLHAAPVMYAALATFVDNWDKNVGNHLPDTPEVAAARVALKLARGEK